MDNNTPGGPTDQGTSDEHTKQTPQAFTRHPKILVVEDDISYEPLWRKVFEEVDPEIEYTWCTSANDAQKILEKTFRDGDYWDLIIADIFLTGSRTGLDLWERCGEPIENMIIVSSVDYSKLLDYVDYSSTPPVYLKKPFKIQDCVTAVNDFVGGRL